MYCSRILRYEYTRRSYVTILTSARSVSPVFPPETSFPDFRTYTYPTTHHLREYTQQVTAPAELTAHGVFSAIRFVSAIYPRVFLKVNETIGKK